jgi:hypothetical protein
MNPEVKKVWISALRSGKYAQTQGSLRQGDRYCCLGVLCDLYPDPAGGHWGGDYVKRFLGNTGSPPTKVCEWAGTTAPEEDCLIDKNDSGQTFDDIADYIERKL